MRIGVYPGSFDPITNGHMDIIRRASLLVDHLIVGVLNNSQKNPTLSVEERVDLINELTKDLGNVTANHFSGLLVEFVNNMQANVIIRGFRAISDFEYEMQLAQTNYMLDPEIETVFLVARNEFSYISSTMVKEVAKYHGDISKMVPQKTQKILEEKFK